MIKEAKATGLTVEEAKDKAIALLGAGENDDIQIDVISRPKKKVLGLFGGSLAEVRVYIELPDEKTAKQVAKKNPKKPVEPKKSTEPKKEDTPAEAKSDEKKEFKPASSVAEDFKNTVDVETLPENSPSVRAVDYLREILKSFDCNEVSAKVAERDGGSYIVLDGENVGSVIGHRGETLDALQYLAGLVANDGAGYYKVSLNIGTYREKREQTLFALAERVSEQVIKTGRSKSLEPMNPYERRIIHTAVQAIDGVLSNSVGEGSSRRIVIYPEGSEFKPPRRGGSDRRGRGGRPSSAPRGRGGRGPRTQSNAVEAPAREPKKDTDMPLYGKIN